MRRNRLLRRRSRRRLRSFGGNKSHRRYVMRLARRGLRRR